jgi:predicted GNAT family N-acyltransferase
MSFYAYYSATKIFTWLMRGISHQQTPMMNVNMQLNRYRFGLCLIPMLNITYTIDMTQQPDLPYRVTLADWNVEHEALSQVRFAVFVREQGVPPELEMEAIDADPQRVVHVVARDSGGAAIATSRMVFEMPIPRIGRMAVLRTWRGKGVGKAMLEFLCDYAKEHGYRVARLNSQTHATPFYYKQGFLSHGSEFVEAGIPHLEMRRAL